VTRARKDLDLDSLIRTLGRSAIKEVLGPLREDEREEQKRLKAELDSLKPIEKSKEKVKGRRADELEEAEDEGVEEDEGGGEEPKPKVVSQKLATGKAAPEAPKAVIPDPSDIKDVTFDQVVTLMNMMRSGRSTKDPNTEESLKDYFKGLNPGEKQALFVLLSGLTQILAGGVEGDAAPDPAEVGIKIKARRADQGAARQSKGVTRDPAIAKPSSAAGSAEPVPIVVGESTDRSAELRVLERLRRAK
jgi:hypothetical protein